MAKKRRWSADNGDKCDIAMGPMIDCTFLLLLYFISVSTIDSVRISKDVVLPLAEKGVIEKDQSGRFIVDIEWKGDASYEAVFKIGPRVISDPAEMVAMIEAAAKQETPEKFRVVIRADKNVPYEFTQQAMAAVAAAKVPNMIFSTLEVDL